jgi:carbon starvation protein CstA
VNALWIVVACVAVYVVAYRSYALYFARNIMRRAAHGGGLSELRAAR